MYIYIILYKNVNHIVISSETVSEGVTKIVIAVARQLQLRIAVNIFMRVGFF
jgi:hypothetical protein